jgi:hypothetical protein
MAFDGWVVRTRDVESDWVNVNDSGAGFANVLRLVYQQALEPTEHWTHIDLDCAVRRHGGERLGDPLVLRLRLATGLGTRTRNALLTASLIRGTDTLN